MKLVVFIGSDTHGIANLYLTEQAVDTMSLATASGIAQHQLRHTHHGETTLSVRSGCVRSLHVAVGGDQWNMGITLIVASHENQPFDSTCHPHIEEAPLLFQVTVR